MGLDQSTRLLTGGLSFSGHTHTPGVAWGTLQSCYGEHNFIYPGHGTKSMMHSVYFSYIVVFQKMRQSRFLLIRFYYSPGEVGIHPINTFCSQCVTCSSRCVYLPVPAPLLPLSQGTGPISTDSHNRRLARHA